MELAKQVWKLKLDKTTKAILMALCDSAHDDGTRCFPSYRYTAWKTDCGLATVYRTIDELVKQGILVHVGMVGDSPEYHIHLENAPLKPSFERPRKGRPRKKSSHGENTFSQGENIPATGNDSHGEKSLLMVRKVFSQREKFSHGEKDKRRLEGSSDQANPGPEDGKLASYPYLVTNLDIPTYDSGGSPTDFDWTVVRKWAQSPQGRARLAAHKVDPGKSSHVLREWREWREEATDGR